MGEAHLERTRCARAAIGADGERAIVADGKDLIGDGGEAGDVAPDRAEHLVDDLDEAVVRAAVRHPRGLDPARLAEQRRQRRPVGRGEGLIELGGSGGGMSQGMGGMGSSGGYGQGSGMGSGFAGSQGSGSYGQSSYGSGGMGGHQSYGDMGSGSYGGSQGGYGSSGGQGGFGMTGSSVVVINPPHGLEQTLREVLPFLKDALGQFDGASFLVETK